MVIFILHPLVKFTLVLISTEIEAAVKPCSWRSSHICVSNYVPLWVYDFSASLLNAHHKIKMKQENNIAVLLRATH